MHPFSTPLKTENRKIALGTNGLNLTVLATVITIITSTKRFPCFHSNLDKVHTVCALQNPNYSGSLFEEGGFL